MNLTNARSVLFAAVTLSIAIACSGCSTVRQLRDPSTYPLNGRAAKIKENGAMAYTIGTKIAAPPEAVWKVLTDASAYTSWNSTVVKLDGSITKGQTIHLVAKVAPERTFDLNVSEFSPASRMVWEDGMPMGMFSGVRTFTLTPSDDGSTAFTMAEVFSGGMLGMIEGSLPDFTSDFEHFAADLKKRVETRPN